MIQNGQKMTKNGQNGPKELENSMKWTKNLNQKEQKTQSKGLKNSTKSQKKRNCRSTLQALNKGFLKFFLITSRKKTVGTSKTYVPISQYIPNHADMCYSL